MAQVRMMMMRQAVKHVRDLANESGAAAGIPLIDLKNLDGRACESADGSSMVMKNHGVPAGVVDEGMLPGVGAARVLARPARSFVDLQGPSFRRAVNHGIPAGVVGEGMLPGVGAAQVLLPRPHEGHHPDVHELPHDGVSDMQVKRNVPNALVINTGVQLQQALSNDLRLGGGGGNLSTITAGCVPAASSNTVSSGGNSVPPAVTTDEDVSKLDLAIVACIYTIVVPWLYKTVDPASSWGEGLKWLYLLFACLSLTLPAISLFTASPGTRRFISFACARFGLDVASAMFIVFIACKLKLGWAAAVVVILILVVLWIWCVQAEPTSRGCLAP